MSFYRVWHNRYLRQHIYSFIRGRDAVKAAKYGNLEAFKYSVLENYSTDVMDYAAGNGHLEVVKWLHENRSEGCTLLAMNFAAECGHLKVVKWLHKNYSEKCTGYALEWAAKNGHFEVVKWLYENRSSEKRAKYAMHHAAARGYLDIVKFLHDKCEMETIETAIYLAKLYSNLDIVEWLKTNNK